MLCYAVRLSRLSRASISCVYLVLLVSFTFTPLPILSNSSYSSVPVVPSVRAVRLVCAVVCCSYNPLSNSSGSRILAQFFYPIFHPSDHFLKNLKHLKKTHIYNKIYHKTHHFMIYLTIQLNLLTKIHNAPQNRKTFRGHFTNIIS